MQYESSAAPPAAVKTSRVPLRGAPPSSETPGHFGRPYANVRPSQPPPVLRSITAAASTPQHPPRPGTRSDSARIGRRGHRKRPQVEFRPLRDATRPRSASPWPTAPTSAAPRPTPGPTPRASGVLPPARRRRATTIDATPPHRAPSTPLRAGSTAPHHHRRGRRRSPTTPPSSRRCRGPEREARPRPSRTSSS